MDIKDLYRQVIMDHYKYPKNKGLNTENLNYFTVHMHNPSCGDDMTVQVLVENDLITDVRHQGTGCSICCSSASVLSETLKAKHANDGLEIIHEFYELIKGLPYDSKKLEGDAIVYQTVHQFPARIKCATLAWKAAEAALETLAKRKDE